MKITTIRAYSLVLFMSGTFCAMAQTKIQKEIKVQKRTLMGQFEPDYVLSIEERIELKEKRIAHQVQTKKIIDTLSISDRKRRRLIRELQKSPFSEYIDKTILAETQFEKNIEE